MSNSMTFYDALNEVLATRRYDRLTGRRVDIRERFSEWFTDIMYRIFSRLNFDVNIGELDYNLDVISLAFMAVGAVLIVVAAIVLYRTFRGRNRIKHHGLSDIFEELIKKNYSVTELIVLSENADNRRLAIRYRYIAALLALNEKQIIEIKPSATNALILRQIKEMSPTLVAPFECTADIFHRAWFGYKDINDDLYKDFTNAVGILL